MSYYLNLQPKNNLKTFVDHPDSSEPFFTAIIIDALKAKL